MIAAFTEDRTIMDIELSTHGLHWPWWNSSKCICMFWSVMLILSFGTMFYMTGAWKLTSVAYTYTPENDKRKSPQITLCVNSILNRNKAGLIPGMKSLVRFHDYYSQKALRPQMDNPCSVCWPTYARKNRRMLYTTPSSRGKCYWAHRWWLSVADAAEFCKSLNGSLAQFEDLDELQFLTAGARLIEDVHRIGYIHTANPCRDINYYTGENITFTHYASGFPNCESLERLHLVVAGLNYSIPDDFGKLLYFSSTSTRPSVCQRYVKDCEQIAFCDSEQVYNNVTKWCEPVDKMKALLDPNEPLPTPSSAAAKTVELAKLEIARQSEWKLQKTRNYIADVFISCKLMHSIRCDELFVRLKQTASESCFSISPEWRDRVAQRIERTPLEVTLKSNDQKAMPFEMSAGYSIYLSAPNEKYKHGDKLSLATGYNTGIYFSYTHTELLATPGCIENNKDGTKYTLKGCTDEQNRKSIAMECNCSYEYVVMDKPMCDVNDAKCVRETIHNLDGKYKCPKPCRDTRYAAGQTYTRLARRHSGRTAMEIRGSKLNTLITQKYASRFQTEFGGMIGMAAGMSMISLVELVYMAVAIVVRRRQRTETEDEAETAE